MGDEVLVSIADRMKRSTRESDVVARVGGDEFAVLWADLDTTGEAWAAIRRLVRTFDDPFQIGDKEFTLDLSVGIATFPADGDDLDRLLYLADQAMYESKDEEREYAFEKV